ncbi:hypothetical protein DOTSEDRAFT_70204 [Dothistroma septosporum NZE10]|uniref:Rhodopsin domain-containing protein n=1 Tax=Dothistroma septosporum (strain NZE10 / CBS 128990) TaxID=675120 RepID=N1PT62_DOTSN|nr:hypothetical protein DOTSEDRAFT_70204 [Dothistroma septosporum NZE10]
MDTVIPRDIWGTAPPEPRSRMANWPTVLFSWWCTSFAAVIIITRLLSRKVRSNKLFREDWIMMASLVPLFIRMVFIHFVLIYGTNNIDVSNIELSGTRLHNHEMGSRLVLAARIWYALFIWTCKFTMSEFLKRITIRVWRRSWEITLQGIRIFLGVTFVAVVVATLTECQPFDHYWQVQPDPGPHCRQGYGNLLTMGICDIVTDILLIAFPIPVVLDSGQSWKRKAQMISLFSLSAIMIAITAARVPHVIGHQGRQQYRTVWASCEVLAAASVSNGVILGSFLRDKGTKKAKYRTFSMSDSIDRTSARRPTLPTLHDLDSDEDLFRSMGCRVPAHLQTLPATSPRPAPPAPPAQSPNELLMAAADTHRASVRRDSDDSDDSLVRPVPSHALPSPSPADKQELSFFDIGNLLVESERSSVSRSRSTIVDSGNSAVAAQDFAVHTTPRYSRPGPRTFLHDVGGIWSPRRDDDRERSSSRQHDRTAPTGVLGPMLERQETQVSLQDAGGLLRSASPPLLYSLPTESMRGQNGDSEQPPRISAATAPARARPGHEDIELEDIDDFSDEERHMTRRAMTLREALAHHRNDDATTRDMSTQHQRPDDMVLHDPGGLARPS